MVKGKSISSLEAEALENSKNAALKRVAKRLKDQQGRNEASASHSSHSSGSGRTHTSYVSA